MTVSTSVGTPTITNDGNITLDAVNSGVTSVVYVKNTGAAGGSLANLDVENDIVVAGLVDGVDVAGLKSAYDLHVGDSSDPHGAAMSVSTSVTTPTLTNAASITIDAVLAGLSTVYILNSNGANVANLDVDGNITSGQNLTVIGGNISFADGETQATIRTTLADADAGTHIISIGVRNSTPTNYRFFDVSVTMNGATPAVPSSAIINLGRGSAAMPTTVNVKANDIINIAGTFQIAGVAVTSGAAELNLVDGESAERLHRREITVPLEMTSGGTAYTGVFVMPNVAKICTITKISVASVVAPSSAGGSILFNLYNYDSGAVASDLLLAAADFNLEGLVAFIAQDIALTAVGADLVLAQSDYVYAKIVSNVADLAGGDGLSVTIEYYET
jgi:hypothetical protein